MNLTDFAGKTALVTGASSGLGSDFAKHLANAGTDLILTARREDALEALAAEIRAAHGSLKVTVIPADLAKPDGIDSLAASIEAKGLLVDILINNAGYGSFGSFDGIPWEKENAMLQLDIVALVKATKIFSAGMKARGWGRILQIASVAAYQPTPLYASYGGAKAFVLSYGLAVNRELRSTGVRCTVLSPGVTATAFLSVAGQKMTAYQKAVMMTSERVTMIGLKALASGKSAVVSGRANAVSAFLTRFLSRDFAADFAMKLMQ